MITLNNINPKIKSYVGFAIKAGKAIFGTDNILKKKSYLVFIDAKISQNAVNKLVNACGGDNIYAVENLSGICNRESCKALAIADINLAKAIKDCAI